MITDKDTLVDAFTRNSYYMPRASEAFLTVKFLLGVRKKKYFLPMSEDINKKQCADPPPKKVVAEETAQALYDCSDNMAAGGLLTDDELWKVPAMKRTAKHLRKRPANLDWMLDVLATINKNHEYFHKDYSKPKKLVAEDELVAGDKLVENADGFFDSLPLAKNAKKKYRLNLNGPSKADKERKKLLRMQKAAEKLQQQLAQQQENIRMAEEQEAASSGDEVLAQARPRPARTVINHGTGGPA